MVFPSKYHICVISDFGPANRKAYSITYMYFKIICSHIIKLYFFSKIVAMGTRCLWFTHLALSVSGQRVVGGLDGVCI